MTPQAPHGSRRALVTGVTGQDGYYLADALRRDGWHVAGGVGRSDLPAARSLAPEGVELVPLELTDAASIDEAVRTIRPERIFHLAAQSHVPTSWEFPAETTEINVLGTVRLIEAMRRWAPGAHFVFAGSSDCFDHEAAPPTGLTPRTPYRAVTPYAVSKLAAMELARRARESAGLRISIAILMNHTSPRRPHRFVERKIVAGAVAVARGRQDALTLGSLETRRDWAWAEDIVEGLLRMGGQERGGDYVLGSGELRTTGDWVRIAFARLGLDPSRHLILDPSLLHAVDAPRTFADIRPAKTELAWAPAVSFETMVERLIETEQNDEERR